jgi:hypothetical protein
MPSSIRFLLARACLVSSLVLCACKEEAEGCVVDADDYARSCNVASDCVIVTEGDLCSECRCPRAVINRESLERYERDTSSIDMPANVCDCAAFIDVECVAGECRGID